MTRPFFLDRADAGRKLGKRLAAYAKRRDVLVLALPRGGVPVAAEVAHMLDVPLDVLLVRKLGVPGHPELAMGAIASGGIRVLNPDVIRSTGVPAEVIEHVARREADELARRERMYRGNLSPAEVEDHTVILIDDGLATGATMRAAAEGIRQRRPARVVVAVPVAAEATCDEIGDIVDEVVCLHTPEPFVAVGLWYEEFDQTSDVEVRELLDRARRPAPGGAGG
jgi:predicted phosphoribosyltransferase